LPEEFTTRHDGRRRKDYSTKFGRPPGRYVPEEFSIEFGRPSGRYGPEEAFPMELISE